LYIIFRTVNDQRLVSKYKHSQSNKTNSYWNRCWFK